MSWPDDYRAADLTNADLDAMLSAPLRIEQVDAVGNPIELPDEIPGRPTGLVMVTDTGLRVPVELRFDRIVGDTQHWNPIIEGEIEALMPRVVAFDGPPIQHGHAITFLRVGPGWGTSDWVRRVLANSQGTFVQCVGRLDNQHADVYRRDDKGA